jgi:predicted DNA binding CopG/RHH family protein
MTTKANIAGTAEAWESGALGLSDEHVKKASVETAKKIDEALGLQAISIRLPKAVIETYKMIAGMHGVGYQPLMRDALCRFADAEMKQLLLGAVEAQRQQAKAAKAQKEVQSHPKKDLKKAA